MTLRPITPVALAPVPPTFDLRPLRTRALANAGRLAHCAPTVMKTLLDAGTVDAPEWLVALVSGLPGGIGNAGDECGALTASLVQLGLRHARDPAEDGVPAVVARSRALLQAFRSDHGSCACRDLLWHGRLPVRCFGIVRRAPERCLALEQGRCADALSPEARRACARLDAHLVAEGFHCAHAVLDDALGADAAAGPLHDAAAAFVGGTAYAGLTCSALTAGVMALGLARVEVEHPRGRVLRAVAGMVAGGRAFRADVEAVNGAMNEGHALVSWFRKAYGTTQCRALTAVDFATETGVQRYVDAGAVGRCRAIARAVAARVREAHAVTPPPEDCAP